MLLNRILSTFQRRNSHHQNKVHRIYKYKEKNNFTNHNYCFCPYIVFCQLKYKIRKRQNRREKTYNESENTDEWKSFHPRLRRPLSYREFPQNHI